MDAADLERTIGMRLDLRAIGDIKPFERNARQITEDSVDKLARVIARQGFLNPIEITPEGVILAGHRRLLAARKLGLTRVPVLIQLDLADEAAGDAYRIEHNRLSEDVRWDRALLSEEVLRVTELAGLQADDLGFTDAEIVKLFDLDDGPPQGAPAVEEPRPMLERGEWWQIGPCRFQVYRTSSDEQLIKAELVIGKIARLLKAEPMLGGDEGMTWRKVIADRQLISGKVMQ